MDESRKPVAHCDECQTIAFCQPERMKRQIEHMVALDDAAEVSASGSRPAEASPAEASP